jgi:hypothetical protein
LKGTEEKEFVFQNWAADRSSGLVLHAEWSMPV